MADPKKYTIGKAMADTRHAIVKELKRLKRGVSAETAATLDKCITFVLSMDERAKTRKGGVIAPRRPLKKKI